MSEAALAGGVTGPAEETRRWSLRGATGHLVELSGAAGGATLSVASALVHEAQRNGEPAAWVAARAATFYPPDLDDAGIDLSALPVVRVERAGQAARAAETLLASDGFTLVILDLAPGMRLPPAALARLDALARRRRAALLVLTAKPREAPSLGCQISLRVDAWHRRTGFDCFARGLTVLRDRRHGPGWTHEENCRGPDGLC